MRTPKQYVKLLEQNQVTEEMLGQVLFSVSKRAKNCRDQARSYRGSYWHYDDKYNEKKAYYYRIKDELLQYFQPICIHTSTYTNYFGTYEVKYLFYKIGDYSFHSPLPEGYQNTTIPVKKIADDFKVAGEEIQDLLSVQFCRKVYEALTTNKATIIRQPEIKA